jgi:hypothetical protein
MLVVSFASDTQVWITEGFFKSVDGRLREREFHIISDPPYYER